MILFYDREGQPLDLFEWARLFEDFNYRVICQTRIANYFISTVWTGLSTPFGTPSDQIYESMIFKDGESIEEFRLSTQGQAVRWHLWACSIVIKYRVKQLGSRSKVIPSTDRGPVWQAVTATMDGQLVIIHRPSESTVSSGRK